MIMHKLHFYMLSALLHWESNHDLGRQCLLYYDLGVASAMLYYLSYRKAAAGGGGGGRGEERERGERGEERGGGEREREEVDRQRRAEREREREREVRSGSINFNGNHLEKHFLLAKEGIWHFLQTGYKLAFKSIQQL